MALTPDQLRQLAPNWSLESDGQLLQYMVSIAKNVEELCSKTRDNLDSLMLNVKQSELALANATNQFSAVEQVKFVENRVEEDDESFYGLRRRRQQVDEPRKEAEQEQVDERTVDDLIQQAVERSTQRMCESYYKFTVPDDTYSSDEDYPSPPRRTLMEAVPKYYDTHRCLPLVIGTYDWQNKWHVGLNSDYASDSDRKEEYSDSPSETDDGGMFPSQPNSKQHTPSESESSIWGTEGRKRAPSLDPSITGDDGSSVYSFASSSKVPRTLPIKQAVVGRPESARLKPPGLFPEEPPAEDGRPSKGERGLFDDSPEVDEPMPTPTPQPRQTVPANDTTKAFFKGNTQPTARKLVNLFDDEPPEPLQDPSVQPERKKTINLFIESDDDEENEVRENVRNNNRTPTVDQSHAKQSKQPPKQRGSALTNPKPMPELIDELNNNLRKQHEPSTGPELSRAVSTESNRPALVNKQRPETNLFDDEPPADTFDQLFQAAKRSGKPTVRATGTPAQVTAGAVKDKIIVNLFAEDDEDDYGGIVVGSNETKAQPKSPQQGTPGISGRMMLPKPVDRLSVVKKKSIFDESESEEDADAVLFGASGSVKPVASTVPKAAAPKVIKSIFSDSSEAEDDDDEALFGKSSSILKDKLDALKRNGGTAGVDTEQIPPSKGDSILPNKSKSIFDEDSDNEEPTTNDPASTESLSKTAAVLEPVKTVKNVPRVSLFDDEPPSDDEDALFGKSATSKIIPKAQLNRVEDTPNRAVALDKPESRENDIRKNVMQQKPASKDELLSNVQSNKSVPKQSSEPIVSQPAHKEVPVDPTNIRSLILKKSIFNSDSESEEDDSIFDTVPKRADITMSATTPMETGDSPLMVGKGEMSSAKEESSQMQDTPTNNVEKPTVEIKGNVEEGTTPNDEQSEENSSQSLHYDVQQEHNGAVQMPVDQNLFEESMSKSGNDNEPSSDIRPNSIEDKDEIPQTKPCDEMDNSRPTLETLVVSNNVHVDTDRSEAITDDTSGHLEKIHIEQTETEEKRHADETKTGIMIANDIDYYLHTNETTNGESSKPSIAGSAIEESPPATPTTPPSAKSEPKSALAFSPIGLFDDVPPPDDGDETDDATQHRQHPHNTTGPPGESALPSIMDETATYPTESQSLNFIPNSGNVSNRSRYLFDDEPPPDEADNGRAKSDFDYPSAGRMGSTVSKGLFDNIAPVSLPPMVEDSNRVVDSTKPPGRLKINKLNSKITINVAALLPGARRSTGNVTTSPEKIHTISNDANDGVSSAASKKPTERGDVASSEKLTGLNKGRAKIPTKRKPPSRHNLRAGTGSSSLQSTPSEEEQNIQNDNKKSPADDRIVVGSEGKIEHIEAGLPQTNFNPQNDLSSSPSVQQSVLKRNDDPFVDRLSASVRNPTKRSVLPDGTEGATKPVPVVSNQKTTAKPSTKSIFDDSDSNGEDSDVFSSKLPSKTVPVKKPAPVQEAKQQPNVGSRSIFHSDDEDDNAADGEDDLFGTKISSIAGQLKSKGVDASASRLGAKTERKGLFDDDDDGSDDDDDLFGSKSRTVPKVNSHQQQVDQTKPGTRSLPLITRPVTTTTPMGDDPLADLLADS